MSLVPETPKSFLFRHVSTAISAVVISIALTAGVVFASSTISDDIATGGQLSVSGTSTLMGNVGIGTTASSSSALSVAGDTYLGGDVTATGTLTVSGSGTSTIDGVLDGHYYQHCTTVVMDAPGNGILGFTQAGILYDPDGNADINASAIVVPSWAHSMQIWGHIDYPPQDIATTTAEMHLYRNGYPTGEAYYHTDGIYPTDATVTEAGGSPIIPANPGDQWTLEENTGVGEAVAVNGPGTWMGACFYP